MAATLPSYHTPRVDLSQDWGGKYDGALRGGAYGAGLDLSSLRQKIPHRVSPPSRTPPPGVIPPGSPGYKVGDGLLHKLIQAQLFIEQAVAENTALRDYVSLLRSLNRWRLDMHAGFFRRYQLRNARSIWLRSTLGVYFNVMKERTARWLHLRSCAEKVIIRAQRIVQWPVLKLWASDILERKRSEEIISSRAVQRCKRECFAAWNHQAHGSAFLPLLHIAAMRLRKVKLRMAWNTWSDKLAERMCHVRVALKIMHRWERAMLLPAWRMWTEAAADGRQLAVGLQRLRARRGRRLMRSGWYGLGHVECVLASDDEELLERRERGGWRGGLLQRGFRGWLGVALEEVTLKAAALKVVLRGERARARAGLERWAEATRRELWRVRAGAVVATRRRKGAQRGALAAWSAFREWMGRKSVNVQWWGSRFAVITRRWEQGACRAALGEWAGLTQRRRRVVGVMLARGVKLRAHTLRFLTSFWAIYARRRATMRGKEAAMLEVRDREALLFTLTEWRREAGGSGLRKASAVKVIRKRERERAKAVVEAWGHESSLRCAGARASRRFDRGRVLKGALRGWASAACWVASLHRLANFLHARGQAEALRRAWGQLVAGKEKQVLNRTRKGRLTHRVWRMTEEWVRRRAVRCLHSWAHAGVQRLMEFRACAFMAGKHRGMLKAFTLPAWKRYVKIRKRDRETAQNVTERWNAVLLCRALRRWDDAFRGKRPRIHAMRKMADEYVGLGQTGDVDESQSSRWTGSEDSAEETGVVREGAGWGGGGGRAQWGQDSEPLSL